MKIGEGNQISMAPHKISDFDTNYRYTLGARDRKTASEFMRIINVKIETGFL